MKWRELVERAGLSINFLDMILCEDRLISIPTLIGLYKALGISPDDPLMDYFENFEWRMPADDYHRVLDIADEMSENEFSHLMDIIDAIIKKGNQVKGIMCQRILRMKILKIQY